MDRLTWANDFWDFAFQANQDPNSKTTRFANANTQRNCFSYCLNAFIGRGTYKYWIDNFTPTGFYQAELVAAFNADAKTEPKNTVAADDVLVYTKGKLKFGAATMVTHATGVVTVECGPPQRPRSLNWKANGSGYYAYVASSFDTPQYDFNAAFVVDQPLPGGAWNSIGMGGEDDLAPPGKVWRRQ